MNKIALLALALLSVPSLARAQTQETPEERIAATKSQAMEHGIPVELLESKIAEGKTKGVSMERIAAVVQRRLEVLERAHSAMPSNRPDADQLDAGADALELGVSDAVLTKIAETAPQARRAVAIAALTQLVAQGIVPERALQQVTAALARGPDALANLPAQAAAAQAAGGRPETPGRPAQPGQSGEAGTTRGPPAAVPAPGQQPATGRPDNPGKPDSPGRPGK